MISLYWSGYTQLTDSSIVGLPTFAGVYKLSTHNTQTDRYTPFYVGQADNIKSRTQQHNNENEPNKCIKSKFEKFAIYINYASVTNKADRDATEVALYNHYKPECNDKDALPDVIPADVSAFN